MNLGAPPAQYEKLHQTQIQREIERLERETLKAGRDNEVGGGRIILTSPDGTRYAISVANGGALSAVAV